MLDNIYPSPFTSANTKLTAPVGGQAVVFNGVDEEWENGSAGGGVSFVVPISLNPGGTYTSLPASFDFTPSFNCHGVFLLLRTQLVTNDATDITIAPHGVAAEGQRIQFEVHSGSGAVNATWFTSGFWVRCVSNQVDISSLSLVGGSEPLFITCNVYQP